MTTFLRLTKLCPMGRDGVREKGTATCLHRLGRHREMPSFIRGRRGGAKYHDLSGLCSKATRDALTPKTSVASTFSGVKRLSPAMEDHQSGLDSVHTTSPTLPYDFV